MHLTTPRRALAAAAAAALLATATGGAVVAAEDGGGIDAIGSTSGATTVLGLDAGDLLDLRLLGEDGLADRDESTGAAEALTRLVPLDIGSGLAPAVNAASVPPVEARSTDGEDSVQTDAVALGAGLPDPLGALLSGTLDPASLIAAVTTDGALGALTSTISDLAVLGGLLELDGAFAGLGSLVTADEATAARGVLVEDLTVLDLSGFLALLGIDLADLSLDQLLGLVDGLGLLSDAVLGELSALVDEVNALLAAIADPTGGGDPTGLCTTLGSLLGGAITCEAITPEALLTALLDTLDEVLEGLPAAIGPALDALELAPLLHVAGIEADVVASAAGTVEDSVADVVAEVGDITVGGVTVPGLDVGATLDQVTALVGEVQDTLDGALEPLGLDGVVDIGLLESATSVEDVDGVITAVADLTALRVTITPPNLCGLLGTIDPEDTIGSLLGELEAELPAIDPVGDLLGDLGSVLDCGPAVAQSGASAAGLVDGLANALLQPLTVEAATVSGTSMYNTEAAPAQPAVPEQPVEQPAVPETPTQPVLPRTGGGEAWLLLGAAVAAAGGLGARRLLRGAQG